MDDYEIDGIRYTSSNFPDLAKWLYFKKLEQQCQTCCFECCMAITEKKEPVSPPPFKVKPALN